MTCVASKTNNSSVFNFCFKINKIPPSPYTLHILHYTTYTTLNKIMLLQTKRIRKGTKAMLKQQQRPKKKDIFVERFNQISSFPDPHLNPNKKKMPTNQPRYSLGVYVYFLAPHTYTHIHTTHIHTYAQHLPYKILTM